MSAVCTHCSTPLPDGSHFCSHCGTPVPGYEQGSRTLTPQGREIFERLAAATEDTYDIVREIGRGGMAVVFLGYQKSLDRHVAMKVLLPILGYDPEIVERFKREARTQGRMEHPNIISVYEVYDVDGLTYFSMPYIPGRSLRNALEEEPKQSIERVVRYICQAADALAYAHKRGVVHRDVKPDNILLDKERDRIILTDFGIAKALAAETTLTTPGDLLGTPQYMSPEQGEGRIDLDGRADQYALGLVAYEMLAGQRPLQADNLAELMYKHRFEEPEPVRALRPDAPSNITAAVTRAISKDRDERFPTMDEFLAAMESPVGGVPVERAEVHDEDEGTTMLVTPHGLKSGKGRKGPGTTPEPRRKAGRLPEATVSEPDLQTTVAVGAVTERRPGISRAVILGGAGIAVIGVALLFLVGPLKLGAPGDPAPGLVEGVEESPDAAEIPPLAADVGETEQGPETEQQLVGLGADGDRDQDDEGSGDQTAPTVEAESEPTGDPARAETARSRVYLARSTAVEMGAEEVNSAGLDGLDARLQGADSQMEGRDFAAALASYSSLIIEYNQLGGAARGQLLPVAQRHQRTARERRAAAAAAGVESIFALELRDLDATNRQAEEALQDARLVAAITLFQGLEEDYQRLERQATQGIRNVANAARQEMRRLRGEAVSAGAPRLQPDAMAQADGVRDEGVRLMRQESLGEARARFDAAGALYQQLATDLSEEAEPVGGEPEPNVETEPPPANAASPEEILTGMVETFRLAFEQENLDLMATRLYQGMVPRSDSELMEAVFDRTDELRATLDRREVKLDGDEATADVRLKLEFRQSRTGQAGSTDMNFRLDFAFGPDGWRLVRVRRR